METGDKCVEWSSSARLDDLPSVTLGHAARVSLAYLEAIKGRMVNNRENAYIEVTEAPSVV